MLRYQVFFQWSSCLLFLLVYVVFHEALFSLHLSGDATAQVVQVIDKLYKKDNLKPYVITHTTLPTLIAELISKRILEFDSVLLSFLAESLPHVESRLAEPDSIIYNAITQALNTIYQSLHSETSPDATYNSLINLTSVYSMLNEIKKAKCGSILNQVKEQNKKILDRIRTLTEEKRSTDWKGIEFDTETLYNQILSFSS
eukprot:TRINITY_DN2858_c0_g1_i1.p1 TRINITY_DN2858_c0_g1~~TRINITY_DN2858_c0_g1_i1.p1  ORF type:complete len:200 (-),score=33.93 TRINITY_DN2858_c0_g1_i1:189-788(-)